MLVLYNFVMMHLACFILLLAVEIIDYSTMPEPAAVKSVRPAMPFPKGSFRTDLDARARPMDFTRFFRQ